MKLCPKCSREYDVSMSFCLDDGAELLYGPASASGDEPATAILSDDRISSEQASGTFDSDPKTIGSVADRSSGTFSTRNKVIAGVVGLVLVTAIGLGGYLYYGRSAGKKIDSIAVMPFLNQGGNPDIEYLSDGMTDTLISSLTQLPDLAVKPRSSVFRYKGKDADAKSIGKELSVAAILNGTVVQRGNDMTLHVELIDTASETLLWSTDYKRPLTNLATLQGEITRDVIDKLKIRLNSTEEQKVVKNYTENGEAYQLYLQGRYFWNKQTNNDIERSIDYFQKAIAIDPNYALAYAGFADAYSLNIIGASRERMAKSRQAALKALSLDDNLAEAHASLGRLLSVDDYDFVGAERELRRAVELNSNYGTAHYFLADLLSSLGRYEEAFAEHRRAVELEPFSEVFISGYGVSLMRARRYDEAIAQVKKSLELNPNFPAAYGRLSLISEMTGKYAECVELRAKALEANDRSQIAARMRESFAKGGWEGFNRYLTGENRPPNTPLYFSATAFTALGEKDKAFEALNKSFENHEIALVQFLNNDPRLDSLRDDPRFHDLMRRIGFTK
jgi:TolB-like protein/Flp pilus assembly protein TadD